MLAKLRKIFERTLEGIVLLLMVVLTTIVVVAVVYRKAGNSLSWYDEVASVLLAWLTYYGAAFAALKRSHIGFPGLLNSMRLSARIPLLIIGETLVFFFFAVVAWAGFEVVRVLEFETLISLPQVPARITQSVIPIGAVLFIICEALSLIDLWVQDIRPRLSKDCN